MPVHSGASGLYRLLWGVVLALGGMADLDLDHTVVQLVTPATAQTASQRHRMAELTKRAAQASAGASSRAQSRLASPSLRQSLRDLGAPNLASLSAPELLQRWRAEMAVAEIAHGFDTSPNSGDVDLQEAAELGFFPNQWQLEVLFPRNLSGSDAGSFFGTVAAAAAAETSAALYRLATFSGAVPLLPGASVRRVGGGAAAPQRPLVPGGWPASLAEASERLVYGVVNSHRLDFPTWLWGNAAVVFNNSAVRPLLTLSPMDTGDFTAACPGVSSNFSRRFCAAWDSAAAARCDSFWFCSFDPASGRCAAADLGDPGACSAAWNGTTLGTASHFDHIFLPFADWHGAQADGDRVLALMLSRMLQP